MIPWSWGLLISVIVGILAIRVAGYVWTAAVVSMTLAVITVLDWKIRHRFKRWIRASSD